MPDMVFVQDWLKIWGPTALTIIAIGITIVLLLCGVCDGLFQRIWARLNKGQPAQHRPEKELQMMRAKRKQNLLKAKEAALCTVGIMFTIFAMYHSLMEIGALSPNRLIICFGGGFSICLSIIATLLYVAGGEQTKGMGKMLLIVSILLALKMLCDYAL